MPVSVSLIVLFAALLHASWNAMLRAGADRFWSMTMMCVAIAVACAAAAPFAPVPAAASWPYALASACLHVGYNLFLVRAYRTGELGQSYPIARGSSPLLVATGAAVFAREFPQPIGVLGILLVCGGIIALAFEGRRLDREALVYAVGTGVFIGAYSVTDGVGVRLSGTATGYTIWMCLLWGVAAPLTYGFVRDWRSLARSPRQTAVAAAGGLVSLLAYGIVIFAMSLGPMGAVSALRETSVVFAAVIGRIFLKERLSAYRLLACAIVAIGAVCIGLSEHGVR